MWPTKSPESCRCSARRSVDSLDVSSEARQFSLQSSPPAPFWSHSADGSHPASFLSALPSVLPKFELLIGLHPRYPDLDTCETGHCASQVRRRPLYSESLHTVARPPRTPPPASQACFSPRIHTSSSGHILSSLDLLFPGTCPSRRRAPRRAALPRTRPRTRPAPRTRPPQGTPLQQCAVSPAYGIRGGWG